MARYREHVATAEGEAAAREAAPAGASAPAPRRSSACASSTRREAPPAGCGAASRRRSRWRSQAGEPLADFVFGFQFSTVAGAVVFGSNTLARRPCAGHLLRRRRGALEIPSVDLAPGVYALDAAVHARDGAPYDYRRDVLRFEVTADAASAGVWSPPRKWAFAGDVEWQEGEGTTRRS